MQTGVNNHGQSINALNTGRISAGRPVLGSWLTYALGTESQNLPAYCVLTDPGGLPVEGVDNWSCGWLPSLYQGTVIRPSEPRIPNLVPPPQVRGRVQKRFLEYLDELNQVHLEDHPGEHDLAARIASYELAARMQTAATEALDFERESAATRTLYGLDDPVTREFGTRCLIAPARRARRSLRSGVHGQPELGPPRRHCQESARHVRQGRSALGGPGPRPQAAGAARFDRRLLGRRDGPLAGDPE